MSYDVLIRSATIIDGAGDAAYTGDVAISGDRIVEIGRLTGAARKTIDAEGLALLPGFVDIHTHYDGQASWDGMLAPSSINGVTSVAMGNCGVGFAPAKKEEEAHRKLISLLEGVEDIPGTALTEGLTWDWESFPDYLDALERRCYAVDVSAHVPHAALRLYVMGERGYDHSEAPTEADIAAMEAATFEAIKAGAIGFSTSRTFLHKDRDGVSINTFTASETELGGAARALRRAGAGVFQLVSDAYSSADEDLARREMKLIADIGRTSGRPISFSLMQADACPRRYRDLLQQTAALNREGLTVRCQVAPRPVGVILGFLISFNPFHASPTFQTTARRPVAEIYAHLSRDDVKRAIVSETRQNPDRSASAESLRRFSMMFRMSDPVDYEPAPEESLEAEASRLGKDVLEHVYDVLLEDKAERLIYIPFFNYSDGNLDAVYEMMIDQYALFGLSDAGAHCGMISDGTFPVSAIDLWRRGSRNSPRIPVELLVHGYTQRNASHVGWFDRGVIAPGYKADINLVDLDSLALPPPASVYDLPAGGLRLMQASRGIRYTLKSGVISFENGRSTGELRGRLLRGPQHIGA